MTRKTKTGQDMSITEGWLCIGGVQECLVGSDEFYDILEDKYTKSIRVESLGNIWTEGLWTGNDFINIDINVEMTIRKEKRGQKEHWYAYRKRGGVQAKRYIGQTDRVNNRKLADVARNMP